MRWSASWMTIWDDRILEYVRENDGAASVGTLADSEYVRVSNAHVSRRCRTLADRNFLRDLGNGVYQLTGDGERYLDGELDAQDRRVED